MKTSGYARLLDMLLNALQNKKLLTIAIHVTIFLENLIQKKD